MAIAQTSQPSAAAAVPNPTQITNTLATLSDQGLQQYAQMHKDDPYTLSLAVAESNRRKMTRSSGAMQQQPQPPVADQMISAMAPQRQPAPQAHTQLPENSGIAQIAPQDAAPQMAGGGIVAFADEGQVKEDRRAAFATEWGPAAQEAGARLDVDPSFLLNKWGVESRWGQSDVARKNNNPGNIKDFSKKPQGAGGVDNSTGTFDYYVPYKDKSDFVNGYVDQIQRNWPEVIGSKSDHDKFVAGLNKGRLGVYGEGPTDKKTGQKIPYGNVLSSSLASLSKYLPMGSAQAGQAQANPPAAEEDDTVYSPEGIPISGSQTRRGESPTVGQAARKWLDKQLGKHDPSTDKPPAVNPDDGSYDRVEQARFQRQDPGNRDLQKEAVVQAAKATNPDAAKSGSFTNDDWLRLGFGLLQSKSPHFMRALGEAGNEMMTGRMAEKKYGLEALKTKAEIDRWNAQANMWNTIPQAKLDAQSQQKVATLAQQLLTKNPAYMIAQASGNQQAMAQLEQQAYQQAHNNVTGSTGDVGSTVLPATGWGQAVKK